MLSRHLFTFPGCNRSDSYLTGAHTRRTLVGDTPVRDCVKLVHVCLRVSFKMDLD